MKEKYFAPEVKIMYVDADIITYSETEEWDGPLLGAAEDDAE